jgi:hypothetical protein
MKNRRLFILMTTVAVLLLIPLIAMEFTTEVNWNTADFLVAGVLLMGTGLLGDLVWRKVKNTQRKVLLTVALMVFLLLLWAELAVGIFGTPFAGQ